MRQVCSLNAVLLHSQTTRYWPKFIFNSTIKNNVNKVRYRIEKLYINKETTIELCHYINIHIFKYKATINNIIVVIFKKKIIVRRYL